MTLTLTLPAGEYVHTGRQVTFEAPCDSEGLTGVIVHGVTYDLVDADGDTPVANSFKAGALISIIFHVEKQKAFIQNANTNAYLESKFSGAVVEVFEDKTLAATDVGKFLRVDAEATITVPADIFPVGVELEIFRNTSDVVTIAASGVLFAIPSNTQLVTGNQTINTQYASIVLKQIADNVWSIQGAV